MVTKTDKPTTCNIRESDLAKLNRIADSKRNPINKKTGISRLDAITMILDEYIENHPDCGAAL